MTKAELIEVLDRYFIPFYQIIGGITAVIIVGGTAYFILNRFIKKL